jgi:hypothetical protein
MMQNVRFMFSLKILVISLLLTGCSMKEQMVRSMDPIMDDMSSAVNMSNDVELMRDGLPASLIQMDGFVKSAPNGCNGKKCVLKEHKYYIKSSI